MRCEISKKRIKAKIRTLVVVFALDFFSGRRLAALIAANKRKRNEKSEKLEQKKEVKETYLCELQELQRPSPEHSSLSPCCT